MTTPTPPAQAPGVPQAAPTGKSVWDSIGQTQEQSALDNISKMLTGTQVLKDEPGVLYALQQQKARPQDAQAIDQFMQGLDAEKQVRLAEAAGSKIHLTTQQQTLLTGLGVDYSNVQYTQQDAVNDTANAVLSQSKGTQQVIKNADGSLALNSDGSVKTEATAAAYKAKGIGRLFQTLHNDILKPLMRDVVSPTGTVLNKAYNEVGTVASDTWHSVEQNFANVGQDTTSAGTQGVTPAANQVSESRRQDMQAQGYDPTSFFSTLAFGASGKAHSDLTSLQNQWDQANPSGLYGLNGQEAVTQAEQFLDNPKNFRQKIENDPTLTPEQVAAKLQAIDSPQFSTLANRVSARTASVGNDVANGAGVKPGTAAYALTAAGANLAAAFMVDPTLILGNAVKVAKIAQVGIDTLGDSERAAAILDPAAQAARAASLDPTAAPTAFALAQAAKGSKGVFTSNVQRGWQRAIDLSDQIREANATGDTVKEAALTARFNAELPALAPILPDFLGTHAIVGYGEDGAIFGQTNGIRSLADAAEYVASKDALLRLMNGRAATQASLMPGALSAVGYRKVKGAVAEWMTARSATRAEGAYAKVLSAAEADPGIARKLIDEGSLSEIQPQADDAVNALTEQVLADKQLADKWAAEYHAASQGTDYEAADSARIAADHAAEQLDASQKQLASAQRGALALTPAGKGDIAYNLRSTGNPFGGSKFGWAAPTAIAARSRLAAQRFTTLLPRNTLIDINDSSSSDKIYKLAMTYLNRGDANALRAAWNAGDGGQRKAIIGGLIDQLGHAAGLGKTETGQRILDAAKTKIENYSSVGDEAILDGQSLALHAGQVRTVWTLPTFRALQQASAKIGLWEGVMGRALTSDQADLLMAQWKMGALFKPSTVTRNQLEGWLRTMLEGKAGDALKARVVLTTPNKELWAQGLKLDLKAEYDSLIADGKTKEAKQLANGNMLDGELLGRSTVTHTLAHTAPLALVGRAYRYAFGRYMSEAEVKAIAEMPAEELREMLEGYGQQIMAADLGERAAAKDSSQITRSGWGAAKIRYRINDAMRKPDGKGPESTSWVPTPISDINGPERYVNALAQRVNATPDVARAAMDVLEKPDEFDISHVVAAMDDPAIAEKMRLTAYGKVYWEDPTGPALKATTPAEIANGKVEFANKVVNDYRYLLTGQNGVYQTALAKELRQTGRAPDAEWVNEKILGDNRPHSVLAPEVMAMPNKGLERSGVQAFQDVEGGAYQWLVERPLQRTTSAPVMMAHYAQARVGLNPFVDKLVEQGISREAASTLAHEMSIKNAWVKTEQLIDDPGLKSQFDVVARNMFPFSRATQAMIRRWGAGMWQDPMRARKLMLAYEGAQHSGFVYTNQYGEPTFTYPGSGVMNMLMREVAKIPGFEGFAHFPLASNMTGGVLMSVPGADNPLRMSMGPMISIPMREIFKLFPDHRELLDEIDSAFNGPIGVGETWSQLVPTVARKFFTAMNEDQRNSALASASVGAIANLAAAGLVPPADASPSERDAFLQNVKTQVRSQLFLRALFGLVAPAAPSAPSEGTSASQADYAFKMDGIGQLSTEYKSLLNDVHGDVARASAIWNALHPDKTVYEIGGSQANASKVALPATQAALNWMVTNKAFVGKYKSVAAYFLPAQSADAQFSDQAYKTQIALGLRERKTPAEFYNDFRVRSAESVFYPAVQQLDAKIAEAKSSGDTAGVASWTQAKSDWETQFKAMNPLFAAKIDSYPDARAQATGQLQDLRDMLKQGQVPDGMAPLLQRMVTSWDTYNAFIQKNKGADTASTEARKQALAAFDQWAEANVAGGPLADLYSGVFRTLDTNIVALPTTVGGG